MTHLTASALSSHEKLCAQQKPDADSSYAATVVQQEQIHQYFTQLGLLEGYDLEIGQGDGGTPYRGLGTNTEEHDDTESSDSGLHGSNHDDVKEQGKPRQGKENSALPSVSQSLKIFMPPQQSQGLDHVTDTSSSSPPSFSCTMLERYLTMDGCGEPFHVSRQAFVQTGCYGDMESVAERQRVAHVLAESVVRKANSRKGSGPSSMAYM